MVTRNTSRTVPKMDPDAQTMADIDPVGDWIWGYGASGYNKQIADLVRELQGTQEDIAWENYDSAQDVANDNLDTWGDYADYMKGVLPGFYEGVGKRDAAATDEYVGALGDWTNPADLFSDPNFMKYVGDAKNHAFRSDAAKEAQLGALGQLKSLTDTKETPQERLMREMARREMEQNMRGDREALARDLKARGAYGSGAEILGGLMSQQEHAQRRSLENMQANANAQSRAMAALGQYSQTAQGVGAQDLQEGAYANAMDQFNNTLEQQYNNFRGAQQVAATNAGNQEGRARATDTYGARTGQTARERSDFGAMTGTQGALAKGTIGNRTDQQKLVSDAGAVLSGELGKQAASAEAQAKDEGLF